MNIRPPPPKKKVNQEKGKSFLTALERLFSLMWEILHQIAFHEPRPARIITVIFKPFQLFLGHRCPTDARWLC